LATEPVGEIRTRGDPRLTSVESSRDHFGLDELAANLVREAG